MPLPSVVARKARRQAATALARLLTADDTKQGGVSLKALVMADGNVARRTTYALCCETLRYLPVIRELLHLVKVEATPAGKAKARPRRKKLWEELVYVCAYDLLFGEGLADDGSKGGTPEVEAAVLARKGALRAALARMVIQRGVASPAQLVPSASGDAADAAGDGETAVPLPRFVRVNTIRMTTQEAVARLTGGAPSERLSCPMKHDELIPDLLVLPPGTDLHSHPLVKSGALILQGKSSCMPAYALSPDPTWQVVDACAAPGNKTTHLAAIMLAAAQRQEQAEGERHGSAAGECAAKCKGAKGPNKPCAAHRWGKVTAFDNDRRRFQILAGTVAHAGASNVELVCGDFLSADATQPPLSQARAVLLDPSCSGSGTKRRRMDHLLPSQAKKGPGLDSVGQPEGGAWDAAYRAPAEEIERVDGLRKFQEQALRRALSLPAVERVAYSTCSVYREENEDVVAAVMPLATSLGFHLEPALPKWPHRGLPTVAGAECLLRVDANRDGTDGFFLALFAKTRADGKSSATLAGEGAIREVLPTQDASVTAACGTGASVDQGPGKKRKAGSPCLPQHGVGGVEAGCDQEGAGGPNLQGTKRSKKEQKGLGVSTQTQTDAGPVRANEHGSKKTKDGPPAVPLVSPGQTAPAAGEKARSGGGLSAAAQLSKAERRRRARQRRKSRLTSEK
eukprot:jgi/Mesvir1/1708/Mv21164-RA.2